jgi:FMN-dependent NADH-azoreductase
MKLLHIDTSILGTGSVSRELSALVVRTLTGGDTPGGDTGVAVTYRDLAREALPHLTLAVLPGDHPLSAHAGPLDAAAQAVRDASQRMLDEFLAADTVVIGVPMYNFTVPSQLKAWIDRIVVPGKTFRYGPEGVAGLAGGKRVIVAMARGHVYGADSDAGTRAAEHAESYLRTVFGFIGITDPEFVTADGLATGPDNKARALTAARDAVHHLAA